MTEKEFMSQSPPETEFLFLPEDPAFWPTLQQQLDSILVEIRGWENYIDWVNGTSRIFQPDSFDSQAGRKVEIGSPPASLVPLEELLERLDNLDEIPFGNLQLKDFSPQHNLRITAAIQGAEQINALRSRITLIREHLPR